MIKFTYLNDIEIENKQLHKGWSLGEYAQKVSTD